MKLGEKGAELIKQFEGYSNTAYLCPAGVWTIGYGHTRGVFKGDTCSQEQAAALLREDVRDAEFAVNSLVRVPITQNQFDALVSFTFNVGAGSFRSSTLLRKLNTADYVGSALEFPHWNKGGGKVLPGLVRRRAAEQNLFLTP